MQIGSAIRVLSKKIENIFGLILNRYGAIFTVKEGNKIVGYFTRDSHFIPSPSTQKEKNIGESSEPRKDSENGYK